MIAIAKAIDVAIFWISAYGNYDYSALVRHLINT